MLPPAAQGEVLLRSSVYLRAGRTERRRRTSTGPLSLHAFVSDLAARHGRCDCGGAEGRRGDVPGGAGRPVVARLARMRVRSRAPRCRRSRAPDESSSKVRNQISVWLEQFSVFLSPKFRIGGEMRGGLELLLPARNMSCTHNFWSIHVLAH